ncbi:sensor histidine kinase [Aquimarina sp. 2-A2]|uniref:sensor histidine kinase n=1 Tax=Aquimarina sp. 2-A2 TaxID=3382644 RepID=UPI00387EFEC8
MRNTASILRNYGSEIMKLWETEVKTKIPAAKEANAIALYDHLPFLINDIADIMERYQDEEHLVKDKKYQEILENSKKHGKHRATTALYTVEQVVHEYIIFHRIITDFIKSKNEHTEDVIDLLKYVIETSILKSVGAFSQSIQEVQEKLIGTLAHDIRNPLSAAQLSLELMKQNSADTNWTLRMRNAAERSVRKAVSLIEGLMDGITVKAGEGMMLNFEEHNIIDDIKWAYNEAKEAYVADVSVESEDQEIIGIFDSLAIRRLLENLIGNAVKYGSSNQPITIRIEDQDDSVQIVVHNHGNPISAEKQTHIFKFLGQDRKDSNYVANSWGMGLTLAQIVANAHGGDIQLVSNEQEGTSFIIKLYKRFNEPGKRRAKLVYVSKDSLQLTDQ